MYLNNDGNENNDTGVITIASAWSSQGHAGRPSLFLNLVYTGAEETPTHSLPSGGGSHVYGFLPWSRHSCPLEVCVVVNVTPLENETFRGARSLPLFGDFPGRRPIDAPSFASRFMFPVFYVFTESNSASFPSCVSLYLIREEETH